MSSMCGLIRVEPCYEVLAVACTLTLQLAAFMRPDQISEALHIRRRVKGNGRRVLWRNISAFGLAFEPMEMGRLVGAKLAVP